MSTKKKIINVGYGRTTLREMYATGNMSSRLFYGLIELEGKYDVEQVNYDSRASLSGLIRSNLRVTRACDFVYMTYLYEQPLILMTFLKSLGFYRKRKIIAISHKRLKMGKNVWERLIYRMVYKRIDMFFFHSQQNLDDSVALGLTKRSKSKFFYWGDELSYVDRTYKMSMGDFFISTGRENRDFDLMIKAFAKTNAQLELYTNRINYGNNYEDLEEYQNKYPNVDIKFVDKSNDTTIRLAQRTAECRCVMIPLMKDQINYCVGLTSIIEAMAMGKPIISSPNPYSPVDIAKEKIGIVADSEEEWVAAINYMQDHPAEAEAMGQRARRLAEEYYNVNSTAKLLDGVLQSF